jgi:hypothetical protein
VTLVVTDTNFLDQHNAQKSEELAYRLYGESKPPDHDLQAPYAL